MSTEQRPSPSFRPRVRPLLFDEFPALRGSVPWLPLATLPTPVTSCDAIAPWLGRKGVWMKRDDECHPRYGGNKVRRYEFLLADALERGARRIVTVGGLASTQVTATAVLAPEVGLPVRAVLFDQPVTSYARRALLMDVSAGAELLYGGGYATTAYRALRAHRAERGNYFVMPGAAGPRANLGYLDAMLELAVQVHAGECPRPDVIVLPTGSSGTLAALALGAAYLRWPTEIVGVRITTSLACNRFTINRVIAATEGYLSKKDSRFRLGKFAPVRYRLYGEALGPGYGYPTPGSVEAIPQVEKLIGVPGEVTYTGKALDALRALCHEPGYANKKLLLWNTLSSVQPPIAEDAMQRLPEPFRRFFVGPVEA